MQTVGAGVALARLTLADQGTESTPIIRPTISPRLCLGLERMVAGEFRHAESGYGYWYPAKVNDGVTAGDAAVTIARR